MNKTSVYLLIAVSFLPLAVLSQDKIYFNGEVKDGKVTEITPDKIKFKNPENPGPVYTVSRSKVLLVFNSNGGFLVMPQMDGAGDKSQAMIQDFLQPPAKQAAADKLVTLQNTVINCRVDREDDNTVYYTVSDRPAQADKSTLALIIYKDGRHKLFADVSKVVPVLSAVQVQLNAAPPVAVASPKPVATVPPKPVAESPVVHSAATGSSGLAAEKHEPAPVARPVAHAEEKPAPPPSAAPKESNATEDFGGVSFKEYEKKALQKTDDLNTYLKILCDKSTQWEEANKAIDQAVALFVNEDATVQISAVGKEGKVNYKIRDYLKRMKLIKYDKVEIEWTNIQYVSKLRKGADGNYYGVITFEQVFKGYMDNKLMYSDKTRKNAEVVLKAFNRNSDGKSQLTWDVLLSDIGVVATKA